jgi:hypothetical protein
MSKSLVVVAVLVGLTSQASADKRDVWKGVFAGSLAVMAGGGTLFWYGNEKIDDAKDRLCAGGAYAQDPACPAEPITLTFAEARELNEQGERGSTYARLGTGMIIVGSGVAAYAFYKAFIEEDPKEPGVVVAPAVTPSGAGASVSLRW